MAGAGCWMDFANAAGVGTGAGAMVRVAKDQPEPASALAWAASDSGAARNTAQCASNTSAISKSSRPEGRRLEAVVGRRVMAWRC